MKRRALFPGALLLLSAALLACPCALSSAEGRGYLGVSVRPEKDLPTFLAEGERIWAAGARVVFMVPGTSAERAGRTRVRYALLMVRRSLGIVTVVLPKLFVTRSPAGRRCSAALEAPCRRQLSR